MTFQLIYDFSTSTEINLEMSEDNKIVKPYLATQYNPNELILNDYLTPQQVYELASKKFNENEEKDVERALTVVYDIRNHIKSNPLLELQFVYKLKGPKLTQRQLQIVKQQMPDWIIEQNVFRQQQYNDHRR